MKERDITGVIVPIASVVTFAAIGVLGSTYSRQSGLNEPKNDERIVASTASLQVEKKDIDPNTVVDYKNYTDYLIDDNDISFDEVVEEATDSENYLRRDGDVQTYLVAKSTSQNYEYTIRTRDDLFKYLGSIDTNSQAMAFMYAVEPGIIPEFGAEKTNAFASVAGAQVNLVQNDNGSILKSTILLDNSSGLTIRMGDKVFLGNIPN